ncbi:hypothetical protein AGR2A_Lc30045 [Agrobacterium genomosp. 2 str. CFBP 5494]|uniref:Uncharacterized protein n=1 Tax=Agrobacterium genomosp. 2 str. CFBP 5494 TaxID=1183436 RepID=A0A9W5B470_9HYPH|nr:hypothetical protein AGR2A_Lc30045 [Agrobacterium genomosp. 2 str. CFBP 5494]
MPCTFPYPWAPSRPCDRTGQNQNPINAGDLTVRLWVSYQRFEKTLGTIPGIVQRPVQIIQSIPVSI